MRLLPAVMASAALALAPVAASMSTAAADDIWNAAIAVSPSTGAVGTISGPASRKFEENAAKDLCARNGATDCQVVTSFTNTCATVAKGVTTSKGEDGKDVRNAQFFAELGGDDDDETDARQVRVLDACKAGAQECVLVTTYCAAFEQRTGI
ncbi:DUF4189 domain-containing protein [Segniliparus rugosus]|uniref:DUF4189 domain-containing protein n=1 Tax=Segniliparus rugosus (strain ATCC BAA-974 / DSM 45345 / CCUG 50838 / CIP 108380 / JCM 13579 / CDC 945) TaxID=679197 RepID=E5XNW1_SEGRC|nr:DUF4189 domain-containing protein [Segniliparus rugosus]EFV13956.1 hypothetical protein HMPREF9336_01182 [Segniliparus rugosus ATCC BAA-974]